MEFNKLILATHLVLILFIAGCVSMEEEQQKIGKASPYVEKAVKEVAGKETEQAMFPTEETPEETEGEKKTETKETAEEEGAEGEKTETKETETPVKETTSEADTETFKACGAVDNQHIIMKPEEKTSQEKESIVCFNERLVSCGKATFNLAGDTPVDYEIKGKEGEICLIALDGEKVAEGTISIGRENLGKTCKLPMEFIEFVYNTYKKTGNEESTYLPIILALGFGEFEKPDGKKVKIVCE